MFQTNGFSFMKTAQQDFNLFRINIRDFLSDGFIHILLGNDS